MESVSITLIPVSLALSIAPGIVLDNHGERERDEVVGIHLKIISGVNRAKCSGKAGIWILSSLGVSCGCVILDKA